MNINTTEIMFPSLKKLPDVTCEQSIDAAFSLPDYYPEVSKILKCIAEINVQTRQVRDGRVEIGGQAVLTLVYSDGDNSVNSFVHNCPFTKSVQIEGAADGAFVSVTPKPGLINSKATAPRKLEVHGSFTMSVSVMLLEHQKLLSSAECYGLYTKVTDFDYAEPSEPVTKSVFIEDEISVGNNKPPVAKIIRSSASAVVTDCKTVGNKAVVKGNVRICILYCPAGNGRPILINEQRSFSQIIECDGLCEESKCECTANAVSLELHPKTSVDGEVRNIGFECKINIDILSFKDAAVSFVTDAFSSDCQTDAETVTVAAERMEETVNENYVCKKSLDFSDGALGEISDLWCRSFVDYASCDGRDILVKGTITIWILGSDKDAAPCLIERSIDYEYRYTVEGEGEIRCSPKVSVAAVNYSQNSDGGVDVAVELNVSATVFSAVTLKALCKVSEVEGRPAGKDDETAVTLYFAEGETVWDIAKKYYASPQKICAANEIEESETVCNKMLLIPNN